MSVVADLVGISRRVGSRVKVPNCRLSDDLDSLFQNRKFTDVIISAGDRDFQARKAILAARNSVFAAAFERQMEESKRNSVEITDVHHQVLGEMLRFVYTGTVSNLEKLAGDVLSAADKYALERLKLTCEDALFKRLSVQNAAETFILADLRNANHLKEQTIQFVKKHATRVMETSKWKSMFTSHPNLVAEAFRALAKSFLSLK